MGILVESGATPLTQKSFGNIAMSKGVMHQTTVRQVIHWVSVIQESQIPLPVEGCVKAGGRWALGLGSGMSKMWYGGMRWEITTTAGILLGGILMGIDRCESGASPLTQIWTGITAMFLIVIIC